MSFSRKIEAKYKLLFLVGVLLSMAACSGEGSSDRLTNEAMMQTEQLEGSAIDKETPQEKARSTPSYLPEDINFRIELRNYIKSIAKMKVSETSHVGEFIIVDGTTCPTDFAVLNGQEYSPLKGFSFLKSLLKKQRYDVLPDLRDVMENQVVCTRLQGDFKTTSRLFESAVRQHKIISTYLSAPEDLTRFAYESMTGKDYFLNEKRGYIEINIQEGLKLHHHAANAGSQESIIFFAHLYSYGKYDLQDYDASKMWLEHSIKHQNSKMSEFYHGEDFTTKLDDSFGVPYNLFFDDKRSSELLEIAKVYAMFGSENGYKYLIGCYVNKCKETSNVSTVDFEKAFRLSLMASDKDWDWPSNVITQLEALLTKEQIDQSKNYVKRCQVLKGIDITCY